MFQSDGSSGGTKTIFDPGQDIPKLFEADDQLIVQTAQGLYKERLLAFDAVGARTTLKISDGFSGVEVVRLSPRP